MCAIFSGGYAGRLCSGSVVWWLTQARLPSFHSLSIEQIPGIVAMDQRVPFLLPVAVHIAGIVAQNRASSLALNMELRVAGWITVNRPLG
jgi:hypothetical protein